MEDLLQGIPGPIARRGDMQLDEDGNYWLFTEDFVWTQITKEANPDANWKA